ncbi:MAG: hypothetical protein C4542_04945 [Dehalococcoidia bacterium]|nr:MAG: hypothetical protein C4542_04945 [Dehalococcoidia bacterium]
MNIGILLAIVAWLAAVSFVAATKIKAPALAVIVTVSASIVIPLALAILYTSFFPWSPLGPEEFLDKYLRILIGEHGDNLPRLFISVFIGVAFGFAVRYIVTRLRRA